MKLGLEKLNNIDVKKVAVELMSICRMEEDSTISAYAAAYVLYRFHQLKDTVIYPFGIMDSIESFIESSGEEESRSLFLKHTLRQSWANVKDLVLRYSEDVLKAFILFFEPNLFKNTTTPATPESITKLAIKFLEIKPNDRVADLATGRGSFIRECFNIEPNAKYVGKDINTFCVEIAKIRAELLDGDITILQENILDNSSDNSRQYDKAFANFPLGLSVRSLGMKNQNDYLINSSYDDFLKASSMDWYFCEKAWECIDGPNRRAICLVANGSTWNTLDKKARENLVSAGIVEGVIALPERLLDYSSIGTALIILKFGCSTVKLVDARNMCEKGRRLNILTDKNIDEIYKAFCKGGKNCKTLNYEELEKNDFVLNPVRYMASDIVVENGVPFESLIKNITRGAQIPSSQLDTMLSSKPTDIQYLMLSNIKDGIIDEELPYLTSMDKSLEKYCLKPNSLILSKNGAPFKVAVADNIDPNKKVIANGNLFIIDLDNEQTNPYFIKAFFESETGKAVLNSIVVGSSIPNIGLEQLKKIKVPKLSKVEQNMIAARYQALVDEVKVLRRKTEKALDSIKHLFDNNKEN